MNKMSAIIFVLAVLLKKKYTLISDTTEMNCSKVTTQFALLIKKIIPDCSSLATSFVFKRVVSSTKKVLVFWPWIFNFIFATLSLYLAAT
jgi:hypothetical protein